MNSAQIVHMLQERYPSRDGWACFAELADGTGSLKSRTADFVAISTWPSKGYRAIGFEIKVSRGDFLRELAKPEKRKHLEDTCAECWFVAPAGILKAEEIPEGWGLLEVLSGAEEERLRAKVHPRQRDPKPWPMPFVAAIVRRCADADPVLPARAWRFAGRDLSLADLRKLLDLLDRREKEMLLARIERSENRERERRDWSRRLGALHAAVVQQLGYGAGTAEGFLAAMNGKGETSPNVKRRMVALARDLLTAAESL